MAYTRVSMRKTREILRLHHSAALSNRAIARSLKLSASTVSECLARQPARAAAVRWPLPGTMTDTALEQALYPPPPERSVPRPLPAWATVHRGTQTQRRHADVAVGRVQSRTPQRGDVLCLL